MLIFYLITAFVFSTGLGRNIVAIPHMMQNGLDEYAEWTLRSRFVALFGCATVLAIVTYVSSSIAVVCLTLAMTALSIVASKRGISEAAR